MNKGNLPPLSVANQLLPDIYTHFTGIHTHVSYHPTTNLARFMHCYIDVSGLAQVWTKFNLELVKLIDVFKSNVYPENFINTCFKTFHDNKHRIKEKVKAVLKKLCFLVLSFHVPFQYHCKLEPS